MAGKKSTGASPGISDELRKQAESLIAQAFDFFRRQFGSLSNELDAIDLKHRETRQRIKRGPRRTDGRIV